jgi:hypothetical protein
MHTALAISLIISGILGLAFVLAALMQFSVHAPIDFPPPLPGRFPFPLLWMILFPVSGLYVLFRALAALAFHWTKYRDGHLAAYLGALFSSISYLIILALR